MFVRVLVIELLDGDVLVYAYFHLAGVVADDHFLNLSAKQEGVRLGVKPDNWHEETKNVNERAKIHLIEVLNRELLTSYHG